MREVMIPGLQNRGISGYTDKASVTASHAIAKNVDIQAMFTISFTSPDCTFV